MKLEIIVEQADGVLQGRIEGRGWMPTPFGRNTTELVENLKMLVADYILHEGANDRKWNKIDWLRTEIEFTYDLQTIFDAFDYLNFSKVAERLGINKTLLSQYKSGIKTASSKQAKKIQDVLHEMGNELVMSRLVA